MLNSSALADATGSGSGCAPSASAVCMGAPLRTIDGAEVPEADGLVNVAPGVPSLLNTLPPVCPMPDEPNFGILPSAMADLPIRPPELAGCPKTGADNAPSA